MISIRLMSAVVLPTALLISACGGESSTIPSAPSAITPDTTATATATPSATPATAEKSAAGFGKPDYATVKKGLQRRAVPARPSGGPVVSKALSDNLNAGSMKEAERFLKMGADVNYINANREPVLYTAIRRGNYDFADSLILYGADPNVKNGNGMTPLHLAISKGHQPTIDLLLKNGADASAQGPQGSPLYMAIERGNAGLVKQLLEYSGSPSSSGPRGPVLYAAVTFKTY